MPWSLQLTVEHLRDCQELSEVPGKPLRLSVEVTDEQVEALAVALHAITQQRQQTRDIAKARRPYQ